MALKNVDKCSKVPISALKFDWEFVGRQDRTNKFKHSNKI